MQFLVDASLPRSTTELLKRYGHEAIDVRDIGLKDAKDREIASYAQSRNLCLVTSDLDFSDIRNYPPGEYSGLVVLRLPFAAASAFILNLLESFLRQETIVNQISGRLAIVEPGRIRIRNHERNGHHPAAR